VDERTQEEFRRYVIARSPALLRTAYLLTGQRADAEDLLQTTLAKMYVSWSRPRNHEARDGYVGRTMMNTYLSSWRRRRRLVEVPTEVLPERPSSVHAADELVLHDLLWRGVMALPHRQRAAIVLRYYEDLSEAETARVLGVSLGTVKSSTSRALASLRRSAAAAAGSSSASGEVLLQGVVG
jgi:RNA polymerase sigma-70 factor, ECF subfamily